MMYNSPVREGLIHVRKSQLGFGFGLLILPKIETQSIFRNLVFCKAELPPKTREKTDFGLAQFVLLTGPFFPIGIEHLIYMKFFCYGSSYGYLGHINIDGSAPDWPGTVQKHSDTSTTLKK